MFWTSLNLVIITFWPLDEWLFTIHRKCECHVSKRKLPNPTWKFMCIYCPNDWHERLGIPYFVLCRLNVERETLTQMQRELEENRLQLVQASSSLAQSQSQASFVHDLQQQCAHLRHELDATRVRLDNLIEMQSQNSPHSKASFCHHCSVEKVDKGLQTALPLPAVAVDEILPTQDEALVRNTTETQLKDKRWWCAIELTLVQIIEHTVLWILFISVTRSKYKT